MIKRDTDQGGHRLHSLADGTDGDDAVNLSQLQNATGRQLGSLTLLEPLQDDNITLFRAPRDLKITKIVCVLSDAAQEIRCEFCKAFDRSDGTVAPFSTVVAVSNTTGTEASANIDVQEGEWVWLTLPYVSATIPFLSVVLTYEPI